MIKKRSLCIAGLSMKEKTIRGLNYYKCVTITIILMVVPGAHAQALDIIHTLMHIMNTHANPFKCLYTYIHTTQACMHAHTHQYLN